MVEIDVGFGTPGGSFVSAAKSVKLSPHDSQRKSVSMEDSGLPMPASLSLSGTGPRRVQTQPTTERGRLLKECSDAIEELQSVVQRSFGASLKADALGSTNISDAGFGPISGSITLRKTKARKSTRELKPLDVVRARGGDVTGRVLRTKASGEHLVEWSPGDRSLHSPSDLELAEVAEEPQNALVSTSLTASGSARVTTAPMLRAAGVTNVEMGDTGL